MDYNARWYSPSLGRFTQPDTIVSNPINPQTLNRYSYVANNPINFIDPTGHIMCDWNPDTGSCYEYPDPDPSDDNGNGGGDDGAEEDLYCAYGDERTCNQADNADAAGALFSEVCNSLLGGIPSYSTTCNNMGMAITISMHPNANVIVKDMARKYFELELVAHMALALGIAGLTCSTIATCATAAERILCGDGDCTNEVSNIAVTFANNAAKVSHIINNQNHNWNRIVDLSDDVMDNYNRIQPHIQHVVNTGTRVPINTNSLGQTVWQYTSSINGYDVIVRGVFDANGVFQIGTSFVP